MAARDIWNAIRTRRDPPRPSALAEITRGILERQPRQANLSGTLKLLCIQVCVVVIKINQKK